MSYLPADGLFGDLFAPVRIGPDVCLREADAKTADMFAKRQQVKNDWNPTGTYTPDDLEAVVDAAFRMMKNAGVLVIDKALSDAQLPGARSDLQYARESIFDQESKQFEYRDAIRKARAAGIKQITAPGLKRFVIGAMEVTQAAVFVAATVACDRPWWLDILVDVLKIFAKAANLILSIAGVVYDATKAAVEVVDKLGKVIKYSMYAGVVVGAWWVWNKYLRT